METTMKRRQPQMNWSKDEEQALQEMIESAPNKQSAMRQYAALTGRSQQAVSQHYYTKMRTSVKPRKRKKRQTTPAVFVAPRIQTSPTSASYRAYSLPELIKIHDTVKAELRERMRAELERL